MRKCGSWLIYRKVTDDSGMDTWTLSRWWSCGSLGCPICQTWKWSEWDLRLQHAFPELLHRHPGARWIVLTLPYPQTLVSDLRDEIDQMNQVLDRLRKRGVWPGSGHLKAIRIEALPGGLCEIGIHLLVMICPCCSRTLEIPSGDDWTETWMELIQSNTPLDVIWRTVPLGDPENTLADLRQALETALLPTYCPDGPVLVEKTHQLRGKHLVSAAGEIAGPLHDAKTRILKPGWVRKSNRYRPAPSEIVVRLTGDTPIRVSPSRS